MDIRDGPKEDELLTVADVDKDKLDNGMSSIVEIYLPESDDTKTAIIDDDGYFIEVFTKNHFMKECELVE